MPKVRFDTIKGTGTNWAEFADRMLIKQIQDEWKANKESFCIHTPSTSSDRINYEAFSAEPMLCPRR